ncbi:DUF3560 domain-containing protein [Streptomyces sp. NPDC001822]|uniref:DUF3560 domain-containing protein n=1 Tax=Streptomyces sp. NPDC001822 TaxID=3364614 RepID=UPI00367944FD
MITIRHTRADGTLVEGSTKGDGVYEIVQAHGFRYFPSIGRIGIRSSRDRAAQTWKINPAAEALRNAGFDVIIDIDEDNRRSFAEAEAEKTQRAEDRAARYDERSARAQESSDQLRATARRRMDAIPFGQPMMPDHHSYARDRNYRERTHRMYGKAIAEGERAAYLASRSDAAENTQRHRRNPAVTLRRIERLEADLRRVHRRQAGKGAHGFPFELAPETVAELGRREEEIAEELTFWRTLVEQAEADGFKVWGKADFTKGDFVQCGSRWYEVLRANPKSLTVPGGPDIKPVVTSKNRAYSWDDRLPYDKVTGRRTAQEMQKVADSPTTDE